VGVRTVKLRLLLTVLLPDECQTDDDHDDPVHDGSNDLGSPETFRHGSRRKIGPGRGRYRRKAVSFDALSGYVRYLQSVLADLRLTLTLGEFEIK